MDTTAIPILLDSPITGCRNRPVLASGLVASIFMAGADAPFSSPKAFPSDVANKPVPAMALALNTTAMIPILSFARNMAFNTSLVKAAAWAEMTPVAVCPAAKRVAALTVETKSDVGTAAEAAFDANTAANEPADTTTPRAWSAAPRV